MLIKDMFRKPIDRNIQGVIVVGEDGLNDEKNELEEYVVTRELQRHFKEFYENYKQGIIGKTRKNGVWISGFFGSGKSHFLKMLSYLLENKLVSGKRTLDYFKTEPKNETFALLKKNVKITKERIPSATQLFTPDWIVRYMVENSLGRLVISGQGLVDSGQGLVISGQGLVDSEEERIAKEKELAERFGWKYYLPEAKQDADVREQLNQLTTNNYSPETIKVIDPCMGSGHILVYAFDVLMQIYTQMGYTDKDAALSILENNLYGLDIDKRAFQLAYFAVLMKARQYHKFILKKQPQCHIYAIAESNGINMKHLAYFGAQLDELAKPVALNQMQELIATLHDAKEYGSIISVADYDWELLRQFAAEFDISGEMNLFDSFGIEATQQRLQELVAVGEVLAQKYEVVVTNPPYMGSSGMGAKLSAYVKQNYPDTKSDMSTVMMEKTLAMCSENGFMAMINIPVWMFLSSYEKLRNNILKYNSYVNMLHFGRGVFGSDFGTTAFVVGKKHINNYLASYRRLFEKQGAVDSIDVKEKWFFEGKGKYVAKQENFAKIPGAPVAYWVSENLFKVYDNAKRIDDVAVPKQGFATTDNDKFLRLWFEIRLCNFSTEIRNENEIVKNIKWVPYNKGGAYRPWYGNLDYVCQWNNAGKALKSHPKAVLRNLNYQFKKSITWSLTNSSYFGARYREEGSLFDTNGMSLFVDGEHYEYLLAFLCSKPATEFMKITNPTLASQVGDIARLPYLECDDENKELYIKKLTNINISISKSDWDAFETSWDFTHHPLVVTSDQCIVNRNSSATTPLTPNHSSPSTISQAYQRWEEETNTRFAQLKANEEELNRIFIDIYGLQDELTPEVEDKDVTVRKADLQRDIKSLLSYAVGCMFGRYSLDVEGLAYAGGEFSDQWVVISDQCYRREVVEKYVAQELQRAYGMAEVNVTDGRDLSFSEVIAERGVIYTFGSDEKSSSVDSIKYRRGTSKKLYEGICELSFNSERIKCGIGNAAYDLCSPEILNAITSGSSVELVQRGWQDADSIDWQTIHYKLKTNHYGADEDNVIPITDEDYFEDDIIGRLIAWLKVVYGAETLEENLRFIADALGTSGDTARQKIRNYFLKDFFKDHCKIYQKRPIYWLYDSGKQNGFKALIYMHRYNADTSGQVRAEYLGKMEETYESEINRMQDIMDNGAGREVALAGKRKEKLQKQLHECRDYDAVLGHIALASIAIDLDDGVKVNYVKVQTAKDGKVLPILAKI